MKRWLATWIAVFAMIASTVLPAHSVHAARAADPSSDLCSVLNPSQSPSDPASPATSLADECAKCCAVGGSLGPASSPSASLPVHAGPAAVAGADVRQGRVHRDFPRARGPPALA